MPEYNFMKKNWKLFLCRLHLIPDRYYTYQKTGQMFHYDELLKRCIRLNSSLWSAHNTLQDLLNYQTKYTFDEALKFVERISNNLQNCDSPLIKELVDLTTNGELKSLMLLAKRRTIFAITTGC